MRVVGATLGRLSGLYAASRYRRTGTPVLARVCRTALLAFALAASAPGIAGPRTRVADDRMAAHHLTMVAVNETTPNAGVLTYVVNRFTQVEAYGLARFSVHVHSGGRVLGPWQAKQVAVQDVPGAVQAEYRLGETHVRLEIAPLLRGRGERWAGAVRFAVQVQPPAPVDIRVGGSRVVGFQSPRIAWLQCEDPTSAGDTAIVEDGVGVLRSGAHPLVVAVRGEGPGPAVQVEGGRTVVLRFPAGHGVVMAAYAEAANTARRLCSDDASHTRHEVAEYYARLLRSSIGTPQPELDKAFRAAILTLEYNWITPIGWNECIHHWYSLWHMQHSPAAEWLGQADRSRTCILTHSQRLMPDGAAPQLSVDGRRRRDFGGSNQFFAWQIRHYWRFTGDRRFAAAMAPVLDRLIAQTWREYDTDGDDLLAWGQQIGNQEDYVSTPWNGTSPSIEGIQMLQTRAEIARGLGDVARAADCEARAERLRRKLNARLWMPDLGRYAFFEDPLGVLRAEGQYHTFAYPAIYDTADMLDSWSSVRHMRERLTGQGGEVYCSNDFPWHAVGTWGMQAGAAQQPWAAWALASVGLHNETYRPLLAAARWAMDQNHRGAWPEISVEPTPAYFSPPAGLYVQAVVEALFGLTVDRSRGLLHVRPSFPDHWPSASLRLPSLRAVYSRVGNRLSYTVVTSDALRREVEWALPVGKVVRFTCNGRPADYRVRPGVGCVWLESLLPAARVSRLEVAISPIPYRVAAPVLAAEADDLLLRVHGASIERLEDRAGILSTWSADGPCQIRARVRPGLLNRYTKFGPLGLLNFSRRTCFLWLRGSGLVRWVHPVTMTVLPRAEAEAALTPDGDGASLVITLRNNGGVRVRGPWFIRIGPLARSIRADVQPRSQITKRTRLASRQLTALCWGDNTVRLAGPNGEELTCRVDATRVLQKHNRLRELYASRMVTVRLPSALLQPDDRWREWREWYAYGHWPWTNSRPPLESLAGKTHIVVPGLDAVHFQLEERRLIPISRRLGRQAATIPLNGRECRKLYILVTPLLDNHDTFACVGRLTVRLSRGGVLSRELCFPGDLDWWCPKEIVGGFATFSEERPDRGRLLPVPSKENGDWDIAHPPAFPQPALWSVHRALATPSAVHSVVELDLGETVPVASVTLETVGEDPALGLVAITAETSAGAEALVGTPWELLPDLMPPRRLFRLTEPSDLEGWTLAGNAFAIGAAPGMFATATLNSLVRSGESAIGRALSPPFVVDMERLTFRWHGGWARGEGYDADLAVRLLDADTGAVLAWVHPPGTHVPQSATIETGTLRGRRVRLELVDNDTAPSYAWIGISEIVAEYQTR